MNRCLVLVGLVIEEQPSVHDVAINDLCLNPVESQADDKDYLRSKGLPGLMKGRCIAELHPRNKGPLSLVRPPITHSSKVGRPVIKEAVSATCENEWRWGLDFEGEEALPSKTQQPALQPTSTVTNPNEAGENETSAAHQATAETVEGNPVEAATAYNALDERDASDIEAKREYAKRMALARNYPLAITLYKQLLLLEPGEPGIHTNLANVYRAKDEHEKAIDHYKQALALRRDLFQALKGLAISLAALERYNEAEEACAEALAVKADDQVYCIYSSCRIANGRINEAVRLLAHVEKQESLDYKLVEYKILRAHGAHAEANGLLASALKELKDKPHVQAAYVMEALESGGHENLAELLERYKHEPPTDTKLLIALATAALVEGDMNQALRYANSALEKDPENTSAVYIKADILKRVAGFEAAVEILENAHAIGISSVQTYALLAESLLFANRTDDVRGLLPDFKKLCVDSRGYTLLASLYQNMGEMDASREVLEKAFEKDPTHAGLWNQIAIMGDKQLSQKAVEWIESNLTCLYLENPSQLQSFALAGLYHVVGDYEKAASYYEIANDKKGAVAKSNVDKIHEDATHAQSLLLGAALPKQAHGGKGHIFIVGMPRSGSTLLETILSANQDVEDLGESPLFSRAVRYMSTTKAREEGAVLAEVYQELVEASSKRDRPIKTNKQLNNYLYAPLIASQLPEARIIHAQRHPLDHVLSIYRANFGDSSLAYSSSLRDIASTLLMSEEVMDAYKKYYPGTVYTYNYDALTKNPEVEIRALVYWLDWEWREEYLSPHKIKRTVLTASKAQVRSPINTKSLGGWRRYRKMLRPALEVLVRSPRYSYLEEEYNEE